MRPDRELEISRRRRLISSLLLWEPGLSSRELAQRLHDEPDPERRSVSPTGRPWSHETVASDVRALAAEWFAESVRDAAQLRATTFQRYEALLSAAWRRGDLKTCLGALAAIREMAALDSPNVAAFAHVEQQLHGIFNALELEFINEPSIVERIYKTLAPETDTSSSLN